MAQQIGKYAANKILKGQLKKYAKKEPIGQYDPYYEYRPDPHNPRKQKKFKKQIPSYIPEHDAKILANARKQAYRLDCALFNFLGVRFGWSSVIGLIPELGDVLDMVMALMLFQDMKKINGGLPSSLRTKMLLIIVADLIVGLVPLLGDYLDAMIKANTINVRMLEKYLDQKYKPREVHAREEQERKQNPNAPPPAPATVYEEIDTDDELPQYSTHPATPAAEPSRPERARVPDETRGGPRDDRPQKKSGGWFSKSSTRQPSRPADPEMGQVSGPGGASALRS